MNFSEIIFSILSADSTLTSLLGASASTAGMKKIYPDHAPQKESAPFVVYSQVSEAPDHAAQGLKVRNVMVQVDAWAAKPADAATISERIITLLDGYAGTVEGYNVDNILFENNNTGYEPDLDPPLYGRQIEFKMRITL